MKIIRVFILVIVLFSLPVFAQNTDSALDQPVSEYFLSLGGLAALVVIVTSGVKKLFKIVGDGVWITSWVISLLLSAGGYFLQLGIFDEVGWYFIFIYGVGAGIVANGLYEAKRIMSLIQLFLPKKE